MSTPPCFPHIPVNGVKSPARLRRLRWNGAFLAPILLALSSVAGATTLDFQQALKRALANNPDAVAAGADERAASGAVTSARGAALPRLSLQFQAARSNNALRVFGYKLSQQRATFNDFGLPQFTGAPGAGDIRPDSLNRPGYLTNYDTGVVLDVPLFAGGGNLARLHQAEAKKRSAAASQRVTRDQLAFEVLNRYQSVFAARELLTSARQSRRAARTAVQNAKALHRQGVVVRSDVLTAEAHLADTEAEVQSAKAGVADALARFRLAIGADPDADLAPAAALHPPKEPENLHTLQTASLANNPQLSMLDAQRDAGRLGVTAARAAYWPQISLELRHDWNARTPAFNAPSNTIMGTLTWNVFDFGATRGSVDSARSELDAIDARRRKARNHLLYEVGHAYRALGSARAHLHAARTAEQKEAAAAHLLQLRYQQGLTTLDNLLKAQAGLDQARADLIDARLRTILTAGRLSLLTGHIPDLTPAAPAAATANSH